MGEHKYAELAQKLRGDILAGVYAGGQKLPSENELAEQTGYSRSTVRQAVSLLEQEGLANRVRGSGTYVRSAIPNREPTRNIAVVTTYIGEYIFPIFLHGIDHVLSKNGYTSMLGATRNRVDNERRILSDLLEKPIDGMIVEGTKTAFPNPNIDLYERFSERGIPVVFINGYYPDLKSPVFVVADDRAGGRMACSALLQKGHQKIAGIFKSDDIQGHRRYQGYAEALRSAGLAVADDHVIWYDTENRGNILEARAAPALRGCTAAVCYNDETALLTLEILEKSGDPARQKVDFVSFDHSTFARLSATPFLSLSISQENMGRLAAKKLLKLLEFQKEPPSVLQWEIEPEDRPLFGK